MEVRDIMCTDPVCYTRFTSLREIAQAMLQNDCGAIPIVESRSAKRIIGIITDRDIVCRTVAEGKNPLELKAGDCMSCEVATVEPDTSIEECCRLMERRQVRRIPVVDGEGCLMGMVSLCDIAENSSTSTSGHLVKEVSHHSVPM